ncbi:hypothetical protein AYI68_g1091 [Smittium mucronatum]|uniref:Uncharacterized protein n=1 Tax=Smittium mucronatum TaxID=133383 RepID=A0A1R0H6M5_9FUNG|nr:hypothetical protein AYI68_g1091 [Smittium mucronatum]
MSGIHTSTTDTQIGVYGKNLGNSMSKPSIDFSTTRNSNSQVFSRDFDSETLGNSYTNSAPANNQKDTGIKNLWVARNLFLNKFLDQIVDNVKRKTTFFSNSTDSNLIFRFLDVSVPTRKKQAPLFQNYYLTRKGSSSNCETMLKSQISNSKHQNDLYFNSYCSPSNKYSKPKPEAESFSLDIKFNNTPTSADLVVKDCMAINGNIELTAVLDQPSDVSQYFGQLIKSIKIEIIEYHSDESEPQKFNDTKKLENKINGGAKVFNISGISGGFLDSSSLLSASSVMPIRQRKLLEILASPIGI